MVNFKWSNLRKEIEDIEQLPDELEKDTRHQLLRNIIDTVNKYNYHISNYNYNQKKQEIIDRGVVFIPQAKSNAIKVSWSKLFTTTVGSEIKRQIGYESYKWHIFSFQKVNALSNTKARQAFNRCKKEKVYVFYQHKEEAYYIENPWLLKSSDFDSEHDIYIFDITNKWTYVHTHEKDCGPYFYRIK